LAFVKSRNVLVVDVVVELSIGVSGRVNCSGVFGEGCLSVVLLMCVGVGTTLQCRGRKGSGRFCLLKLIVFCESIESGNPFVALGWIFIFGPLHNDSRMVSRSERAGRRRIDLLSTKSDRCTRYSIIDRLRYTELCATASNTRCRSAPPRRG
jgi:hypothetical protein